MKKDINRFLVKTSVPSTPVKSIKVPIVRIPRGPTIRWDINYDKLFKDRRKKWKANITQ